MGNVPASAVAIPVEICQSFYISKSDFQTLVLPDGHCSSPAKKRGTGAKRRPRPKKSWVDLIRNVSTVLFCMF